MAVFLSPTAIVMFTVATTDHVPHTTDHISHHRSHTSHHIILTIYCPIHYNT